MSTQPSGPLVATRRLAPEDAPAVTAMVRRCTDKTLYWRLLGGLDPVHAIASPIRQGRPGGRVDIGAFSGPRLIGVASLVPSRGAWEAAILIEDAWQGNKVGSRLADNLVHHAVQLGVDTIRICYGGQNRKAASLVTGRARDLTRLSVSTGVIERLVAPVPPRRDE